MYMLGALFKLSAPFSTLMYSLGLGGNEKIDHRTYTYWTQHSVQTLHRTKIILYYYL